MTYLNYGGKCIFLLCLALCCTLHICWILLHQLCYADEYVLRIPFSVLFHIGASQKRNLFKVLKRILSSKYYYVKTFMIRQRRTDACKSVWRISVCSSFLSFHIYFFLMACPKKAATSYLTEDPQRCRSSHYTEAIASPKPLQNLLQDPTVAARSTSETTLRLSCKNQLVSKKTSGLMLASVPSYPLTSSSRPFLD